MKYLTIVLTLFLLSNANAQWKIQETKDYKGDISIAYAQENDYKTFLTVEIENRKREGKVSFVGFNKAIGFNPLGDMDYKDYGITFKFDDDPTVYYAGSTQLFIEEDNFYLNIGHSFDIDSEINTSSTPQIGVDDKSPYNENKDILFLGIGFISQPQDFIKKIKSSNTLYVAIWVNGGVKYLEYSLKGSSKVINQVYQSKFHTSIPIAGRAVSKYFSNEVLEENSGT